MWLTKLHDISPFVLQNWHWNLNCLLWLPHLYNLTISPKFVPWRVATDVQNSESFATRYIAAYLVRNHLLIAYCCRLVLWFPSIYSLLHFSALICEVSWYQYYEKIPRASCVFSLHSRFIKHWLYKSIILPL